MPRSGIRDHLLISPLPMPAAAEGWRDLLSIAIRAL
jgi:hypothetical protein